MQSKYRAAPARADGFQSAAARIFAVSIAGNLALASAKALAGFAAGSDALLSDAVHSVTDVFSSVIVILGVRLSARESDREHPYGHERFECVAAMVLAMALLATGIFIGASALSSLWSGGENEVPGGLAMIVAAASVAVKELLFRYTWYHAERHGSGVLRADAWHHRSDALCSLGVLVGVAGARMGLPVLDRIASLLICAFIARAACGIFREAVEKLVDHACGSETEDALRRCAGAQPGVLRVDRLQTREFGSRIYADMEISVDGGLTLAESHCISEGVHAAVEAQFPRVKHIMIHVNPAQESEDIHSAGKG